MSETAAPNARRVDPVHAEIRMLVETYYDVQQLRIQTGNRLDAAKRGGGDPERINALHDSVQARMAQQEAEIQRLLLKLIRDHPLWTKWLVGVKGVGPVIAGGLIAWLEDPGRYDTVSKLWAYSGLHVIDGVAPRRQRGEKANWNPRLRTLFWKAGQSFAKMGGSGIVYRSVDPAGQKPCSHRHSLEEKALACAERRGPGYEVVGAHEESESGYRRLYDQEKARLRGLHPEPVPHDPPRQKKDGTPLLKFSDGHVDAMARRKTAKVFAAHLWEVWRKIEGLPIREPYALERMGHTTPISVVRK